MWYGNKLSSDGDGPLSELSFFPLPFLRVLILGVGHQDFLGGNAINPEETEAILIVASTLQIVDTLFSAGPSLLPSPFRASLSRGRGHQTSQGH